MRPGAAPGVRYDAPVPTDADLRAAAEAYFEELNKIRVSGGAPCVSPLRASGRSSEDCDRDHLERRSWDLCLDTLSGEASVR